MNFAPTGFGETIFRQRYSIDDAETWGAAALRIVSHVCKSELKNIREAITEPISAGRFFPAGRTIHGAGRDGWQGNMINCYIFKPEDTKESIGQFLNEIYVTATCGGGTGYNPSNVRPKGADIGPHKVAAPGIISLAKAVDAIGGEVRAGGSRRAAILGAVNITHPDVLEWIRVKQQLGILENHNISIYVTDAFTDAVRNNDYWHFSFNGVEWHTYEVSINQAKMLVPATSKPHCEKILENYYRAGPEDNLHVLRKYPLRAKQLWAWIMESNLTCAEPGILHEDAIRRNYAVEYVEPWAGNNPCTEAVTGHLGNCTLGSLNLTSYVTDGAVNWSLLKDDTAAAVRFLDNVLSENNYPLDEQEAAAMRVRRIGLGVMGYGHMLIDMGLRYGSDEAIEFTHELAEFVRDTAFETSIRLASEKGPCPATESLMDRHNYLENDYTRRLPDKIRMGILDNGIRNAVLLSIAPTGSIGSVAGVSTSIEPVFAPAYRRYYRVGEGWDHELVFDPKFKQAFLSDNDQSMNAVVGAYDVTPEEHMKTIVAWQHYVDQSISKTINVPKDTDISAFSATLLKHIDNIKGVSTYLEGSRGFEPLQAIPLEEAIELASKEDHKEHHFIQDCSTGSCEI